ncbi:MAG TPA: PilZ domain-containing protein, partial [Nitrospira sp.]|nr:PilZ domain-containing protein [Nitrospira sp.]
EATMKTRHLDKDWAQEVTGLDLVNVTINKNASAILDRREAERVPIHSHVTYASSAEACLCRGEGKLLNLSKKGCRIVGPVLAVGSTATISLDLDDGKAPLNFTDVTVCWSDGYSFGVKFPSMTVEDRKRLQELILKLATLRGASQDHTAFRLA